MWKLFLRMKEVKVKDEFAFSLFAFLHFLVNDIIQYFYAFPMYFTCLC